jgi:predicted nucleotidyltransferase
MSYSEILNNYQDFNDRKNASIKQINRVKEMVNKIDLFQKDDISIFVAGSLGRMEFGSKSDIDFFIITREESSKLKNIEILGNLIDINKKLELPEFSNDGKYLKTYSLDKMIMQTGSPTDDHENLFTTRILLLLESKVISNNNLYQDALYKIIENYYKDSTGHDDFFPLYILNDILRYWRTLCLNYEMIRFEDRPWRKKNINLKYARMLIIFATIIPIMTIPLTKKEDMFSLLKLCPLERLAYGLDHIKNSKYEERFLNFIKLYENFLKAKENINIDENQDLKALLDKDAELFSNFLFDVLSDDNIPKKWQKYLVI